MQERLSLLNSVQRKPTKGCTAQGTHTYMLAVNSGI